MVVLSVVFLKFLLSAMSVVPSGVEVIPWTIFVVAIAKIGRKIDALLLRIGLNPAATGDPLGGFSRMPGMLTYAVARSVAQNIGQAAASSTSGGNRRFFGFGGAEANPVPPAGPAPVSGGGTTVRSSVEYAAGGAGKERETTRTTGGENIARGQKATRPQMEKNNRSTARKVSQNGGNTAFSHSDASASAETTQSSRTMASTEPKRAATPSASRPTAQTRTAQTAGRNGGISRYSVDGSTMGGNAAGVKPFNVEGKQTGAGKAGSFYTDKNIAADGLFPHSNLADVRGSQGADGRTSHHTSHTTHTSHSSNISVQQGKADRQARPQGGGMDGISALDKSAGERMPRPPVNGVSRQNGAAQDGKKPGRPDRAAQDKQGRSSLHTESVSAHRSAKMTKEMAHSQVHRQTTQSQMHGQTTTPTERTRPASTSATPQNVRPCGINKESPEKTHQENARPLGAETSLSIITRDVRLHCMNKESSGTAHQKNARPSETPSSAVPQAVCPQSARNEAAKDTSAQRAKQPLASSASQNTHSRSADSEKRVVLRGSTVQKAVRNSTAESRPQADRSDKGKFFSDRGKNRRRPNPAQMRNGRATKESGNGYDPRK